MKILHQMVDRPTPLGKENNIRLGPQDKRRGNRKQNKVKPNTLMVFAFVLILFGFY